MFSGWFSSALAQQAIGTADECRHSVDNEISVCLALSRLAKVAIVNKALFPFGSIREINILWSLKSRDKIRAESYFAVFCSHLITRMVAPGDQIIKRCLNLLYNRPIGFETSLNAGEARLKNRQKISDWHWLTPKRLVRALKIDALPCNLLTSKTILKSICFVSLSRCRQMDGWIILICVTTNASLFAFALFVRSQRRKVRIKRQQLW